MGKEKITKNVVPTCYTMSLAIFDFVPVLLCFVIAITLYLLLENILILIGLACFSVSLFLEAIWKIIVVIKKKNVWPLFVQKQIAIPLGLVLFIIGIFVAMFTLDDDTIKLLSKGIIKPLPIIITSIGLINSIAKDIASKKINPNSTKYCWLEQIFNTIAFLSYAIVMIVLYVNYMNLL